jgi:DNA-binding transcriptional ArsR family regulator
VIFNNNAKIFILSFYSKRMNHYYLAKSDGKQYLFTSVKILDENSFSNLFNPIKNQILYLLSKKAMYPAELARKLNVHEQKIYYHIKPLIDNGLIMIKEKKEIRGTIAKSYFCDNTNFVYSLKNIDNNWVPISLYEKEKNNKFISFFNPILSSSLDGFFVVGSPDAHGEFKAYSRDGHYAIDLALTLGNLVKIPDLFSVMLDVDVKKEDLKQNLILIGGPVTNIIVNLINSYLPVQFVYSKYWGLKSKKTNKEYLDDSIGVIAKIENPFNPETSLFILAGIRSIGTKACVLAITRFADKLFTSYNGQKRWYAIVQGFDLDSDGKIDSIDLLET